MSSQTVIFFNWLKLWKLSTAVQAKHDGRKVVLMTFSSMPVGRWTTNKWGGIELGFQKC